jgi:hypothetical protein
MTTRLLGQWTDYGCFESSQKVAHWTLPAKGSSGDPDGRPRTPSRSVWRRPAGLHRLEPGLGRDGGELGPALPGTGEVGGADGLPGTEAIKARPLIVLDLE